MTENKKKKYIHKKNKCNGEMIFTHENYEYSGSDNAYSTESRETFSNYKCNKCNYEWKKSTEYRQGGSNYISTSDNSGFWWK